MGMEWQFRLFYFEEYTLYFLRAAPRRLEQQPIAAAYSSSSYLTSVTVLPQIS